MSVIPRPRATGRAGSWVRAFRATDTFVVETLRATSHLDRGIGAVLARELRTALVRSGAAVVVAAGTRQPNAGEPSRQAGIEHRLCEAAYYVNLARRFGLLKLPRYRALMHRQQEALREVQAARRQAPPSGSARPG